MRELKVGFVFLAVLMISATFTLGGKKTAPARRVTAHSVTAQPAKLVPQPQPSPRYGDIPLSFEANKGQTDPSVRFVSEGAGYTLFLTANEAVLSLQKPNPKDDPALQKMKPAKRRLFESRKFYRGSERSRRARKKATIRVAMEGANPDSTIEPLDLLPGKNNHFIGNDPQKWQTGIPTFRRVKYSSIYPGIDLIYYGKQRQLEFDFVVAPGADPHAICLNLQTDGRVSIAKNGNLRVETDEDSFELRRPDVYQVADGAKARVTGRFVLRGDNLVGLQVGPYDHQRELVIDPALAYSTYLGGNGADDGFGVAVDTNGNAYVVGQTTSTNFPIAGGYSSSSNSTGIAFVSKLNSTGTALLFSTYLGGTGGESGNAIALDPAGNVYVTGYTVSSDFPVVNGYQTALGTSAGNAFVARIDTTQTGTASLVYSTYLGGGGNSTNPVGDIGYGIAVDASGLAYVTGQTTSDTSVAPFPTTSGAYQSSLVSQSGNAFVTVLDTTQTGAASLVYSSYLGGSSTGFGDYGVAIATNGTGNAYITGTTSSGSPTPFPTSTSAFQGSLHSADGNAFVTEIATDQSGASSLVYSTCLGGSGDGFGDADAALAIALDSLDKVYVTGAASSSDFPITTGAYQTANPNGDRSFVSKFDLTHSGTASLSYSTFLGGSNGDEGRGIALDTNGNAYVSGGTSSSDFPTTTGAFQTALNSSSFDGFITKLNPTATGLVYSSYFGGSCSSGDVVNAVTLDASGNPYLAGSTCSNDFPTYPSSNFQNSLAGVQNAFLAKLVLPVETPTISNLSAGSGKANDLVTLAGTNFGLAQGSSVVTFGGITAAINSWSATSIVVLVPNNASPGLDQIVVTTSIATSNAMGFTVNPSVAILYPSTGQIGASISIDGGDFGTSGSVTFNGVSASTTTWTTSLIVALVPPGASTGNVVVTSNSTSSIGVPFSIGLPATISSISANSGVVNTQITVIGTNFGSSQSTTAGRILFNGAIGAVLGWTDTSVTAEVPATAPPGLGTLSVSLDGFASNSFSFTVLPSLNAGPSGTPGGALLLNGSNLGTAQGSGTVNLGGTSPQILGWTPTAVLVRIPASQVSGTLAASVTTGGIQTNIVNCTIAPSVTTIVPGAAQVGNSVVLTGTGLGSSGSVTVNGVSASTQNWTNNSVTVQIPNGATSGPIIVTTSGAQTAPVNFTVLPTSSPVTSITVQPTTATILVGDSETLVVLDSNGNTVTGSSWSVDNASLASISSSVPPVLTALAAGSVTVTATYEGLTAQATWTVSASALSVGTVQWSVPTDGLQTNLIVPATPVTGNAVDLFVIEGGTGGGGPNVVRAITIDGAPVWSAPIPSAPVGNVLDDPSGGLILGTSSGAVKLDGSTGMQDWIYPATVDGPIDLLAVHSNGTAYLGIYSGSSTAYTIAAVDTSSGATKFLVDLPEGYYSTYFSSTENAASPIPPQTGPFTVMPDGSVTFEAFIFNWQLYQDENTVYTPGCTTSVTNNSILYLVKVQPDGTSSKQAIDSSTFSETSSGVDCPYQYGVYQPGEVIPDGQGGLLASWLKTTRANASDAPDILTNMVTHIVNGTTTSYSLPFDFVPFFLGQSNSSGLMVLGDNGTVFAANGVQQNYAADTLFAFDENDGSVKWTYSVPSSSIAQAGDGLSIIAASNGGGVVAKVTSQGVDTVIDFDATGNPTTDAVTGTSVSYLAADLWLRRPPGGGGGAQGITGDPVLWVNGGEWLVPGVFSRDPVVITIPLNVYRVQTSHSPAAISADSIDSQLNDAVKLWGKLVKGLSLQYAGESAIASVAACDVTLHPTGCSTQQDVSTLFLDPANLTTSLSEFKTRFGKATGLQLVFTGTIDVTNSPTDLFPDEAAPFDPPGQPKHGNLVVMSAASLGNIPAHGIGHTFQLPHVGGEANVQNLMCSPQNEGCPDTVPGDKLNKDQVQDVMRNATQWQVSQ